ANLIFCLVRTSTEGKRQEGISFLLIDMSAPGVSVRPIALLDGRAEVNEVWFENVEVPVENRVGEENQGWTIAKFLLGHERSNTSAIGHCKRELLRLKEVAAERSLLDDPRFAAEIAQVEIDLMALEMTSMRVLADEAKARAPGPEASMLKIRATEIQQELTRLTARTIGEEALAFHPDWLEGHVDGPSEATFAANYFNMRKASIYAGSNEIQRNIIAKRVLGV
ncbi:MAG: acyl-CoA dehydrogenase family protein, partial [Myxococcota bacterium]